MGAQISFYMSSEDEQEFLRFVKSTGRIEILPYHVESPKQRLGTLPPWGEHRSNFHLFLYNAEIPGELQFGKVAGQNRLYVEPHDSPVIELFLTRVDSERRMLEEGRLWIGYGTPELDFGSSGQGTPPFEGWYRILARWIRKNYEKVDTNLYAGQGALRLHDEGWRFFVELAIGPYAPRSETKQP